MRRFIPPYSSIPLLLLVLLVPVLLLLLSLLLPPDLLLGLPPNLLFPPLLFLHHHLLPLPLPKRLNLLLQPHIPQRNGPLLLPLNLLQPLTHLRHPNIIRLPRQMQQQAALLDLKIVGVPPILRLPHYALFPRTAVGERGDGALLEVPAEVEVGFPERDGESGDEEFESRFVDAEEEDAAVEAVVVPRGEEEG